MAKQEDINFIRELAHKLLHNSDTVKTPFLIGSGESYSLNSGDLDINSSLKILFRNNKSAFILPDTICEKLNQANRSFIFANIQLCNFININYVISSFLDGNELFIFIFSYKDNLSYILSPTGRLVNNSLLLRSRNMTKILNNLFLDGKCTLAKETINLVYAPSGSSNRTILQIIFDFCNILISGMSKPLSDIDIENTENR